MSSTKQTYVAVVDDDEKLCQSFGRLLRAAGLQPITYPSAEAFLADTKQPRFDCLVLDVQHEAVEPRLFRVREKCFCRRIRDRLKASSPQQPAKRLAQLFIVIDDGDVGLFGAAHRKSMSIVDSGAKRWLLSFREGRWELSQYARFEREPREFRHGRHAQFGRNALAVVFDRALFDAEIIGNLLIQPSADHMTEHLALALAQSPNSLVCFPPLRSCFAFACVPGHRAPDGID